MRSPNRQHGSLWKMQNPRPHLKPCCARICHLTKSQVFHIHTNEWDAVEWSYKSADRRSVTCLLNSSFDFRLRGEVLIGKQVSNALSPVSAFPWQLLPLCKASVPASTCGRDLPLALRVWKVCYNKTPLTLFLSICQSFIFFNVSRNTPYTWGEWITLHAIAL